MHVLHKLQVHMLHTSTMAWEYARRKQITCTMAWKKTTENTSYLHNGVEEGQRKHQLAPRGCLRKGRVWVREVLGQLLVGAHEVGSHTFGRFLCEFDACRL